MGRPQPGKYDALIPDLKKLPPEDLRYQDKVDAVKASVTNRDAVVMAEAYVRLRERKDEINAMLYATNLQLEAYEQLLADSQESRAEGWGRYGVKDNALRLPTGDTVRIQREPYGRVIDKEAFRRWCISNGYENQLQLWPSTMNAIVKERALAGDAGPDGTDVFAKDTVKFVKGGVE